MGRIEAICVSPEKGQRKSPVSAAQFVAGHGISGDAHAGNWHRQVSLLAVEDIESLHRKRLPNLAAGDFAENLVVSGVELKTLGLGSCLSIGSDVMLEITQIGKTCHTPCRIFYESGVCAMPTLGVFTRVKQGGRVAPGDPVVCQTQVRRELFQAVVITVSTRCSQGQTPDTAGPAVIAAVEDRIAAHLYRHVVVSDNEPAIAELLKHYCDGHSIDLILTVGGTGFSPDDVTPEATRTIAERLTPGLDEAMRAASFAKTPHAMLSRGVSGIRGSTLIVNLPGSERAARENLDVILPALPHALGKLRGDKSDCGRIS
jgi:molybdenum cofactor synthesis domain-containing protein